MLNQSSSSLAVFRRIIASAIIQSGRDESDVSAPANSSHVLLSIIIKKNIKIYIFFESTDCRIKLFTHIPIFYWHALYIVVICDCSWVAPIRVLLLQVESSLPSMLAEPQPPLLAPPLQASVVW